MGNDRDADKRRDKAVFDRSCASFVRKKPTQFGISRHASLLLDINRLSVRASLIVLDRLFMSAKFDRLCGC